MKSFKSFSNVYKKHYIFYKELEHDATFTNKKTYNINNVKLYLEDIQIFDNSILVNKYCNLNLFLVWNAGAETINKF